MTHRILLLIPLHDFKLPVITPLSNYMRDCISLQETGAHKIFQANEDEAKHILDNCGKAIGGNRILPQEKKSGASHKEFIFQLRGLMFRQVLTTIFVTLVSK